MIIIAADFALEDPGRRIETIDLARPLQQATRDDEPGCQAYVFSADPCVDGRVVVYELWDDYESLRLHFEHPHYMNMGMTLRGQGLASAVSAKFRVTASEPVYDDTPVARANFFTLGADEQDPEQRIIVAGYIDCGVAEERAGILERSIPLQLATRNDEPGCLNYEFTPDPCNDHRIVVYELWENEAALAAHFLHDNYRNMGALFGEITNRSSDNRKYRVDHSEPVYDDKGRPRAEWFMLDSPDA